MYRYLWVPFVSEFMFVEGVRVTGWDVCVWPLVAQAGAWL